MILAPLSTEETMYPNNYHSTLASYLNDSYTDVDSNISSRHYLLKHLEACGIDLEPLPLFSPTCLDTLRAVNPKVFESTLDEEDDMLKSHCSWTTKRPEGTPEDDQDKQEEEEGEEEPFGTDMQGPATYDVICSRAKQFYQLPGCQRFRHIVRAAIPAYMKACSRLDKSSVIASIIDMVIHHPDFGRIRFWKYNNASNTWVMLNSDQIRDKVGHALREMIQEMKRTQRKKINSIRQVVARAS